jgi:beta-glucosidase
MRVEGTPGDPVYVPSCANAYILTQVVREYWGRPDATHLSDCGAVVNMFWPTPRGNGYTNGSFVAAAAAALNAGMDQNSNTISPSHLWLALEQGLTTPDKVFAVAGRVLAQRFRLGHFDPLEALPPPLLRFGADDLGSAANREAAAEGVRQGAVLLKNGGGVLPLAVGSRILVVGPTALSVTASIGDIYGSSVRHTPRRPQPAL